MIRGKYIELEQICRQYRLERSFFILLSESERLHIEEVESIECIHEEDVGQVERMIRLHRDLDLNVPGIDAVLNLLERIELLETELDQARRRLRLYE